METDFGGVEGRVIDKKVEIGGIGVFDPVDRSGIDIALFPVGVCEHRAEHGTGFVTFSDLDRKERIIRLHLLMDDTGADSFILLTCQGNDQYQAEKNRPIL